MQKRDIARVLFIRGEVNRSWDSPVHQIRGDVSHGFGQGPQSIPVFRGGFEAELHQGCGGLHELANKIRNPAHVSAVLGGVSGAPQQTAQGRCATNTQPGDNLSGGVIYRAAFGEAEQQAPDHFQSLGNGENNIVSRLPAGEYQLYESGNHDPDQGGQQEPKRILHVGFGRYMTVPERKSGGDEIGERYGRTVVGQRGDRIEGQEQRT